MSVLIATSLGNLVVDLDTDKCPLTCNNFLKLCKIKYYNGCLFHSVHKDFIAQTGDPTGTGLGGDSIHKLLNAEQPRFFSDEIDPNLKHSKIGTLAMASAGHNLNASQFYFTLRDHDLEHLDGNHTIFGEVAVGFETLTRINEAYVDHLNRPYENITIKHTCILYDPFEDPLGLAKLYQDEVDYDDDDWLYLEEVADEEEFDALVDANEAYVDHKNRPYENITIKHTCILYDPFEDPLGLARLYQDEIDYDDDDWLYLEEVEDEEEFDALVDAKEAHSTAPVMEMKAPQNVLFVFKLNPVTEDVDLQIQFSRFGTVQSAHIVRHYESGQSLGYAFIQFETKQACEQAYRKMGDALIHDTRIHVDFGHSVPRLWSQYVQEGIIV